MDPDAALTECRTRAAAVLAGGDDEQIAAEAERLAESFEALDDWLRRRGFLPAAWQRARPPHPQVRDAMRAAERRAARDA